MNNEVAVRENNSMVEFNAQEMHLLRTTMCKNCSEEDVLLFAKVCKQTGLSPFYRQIFPVVRKTKMKNPDNGKWEQVESMTIQTGIDGYRLVAERTGRYCPGKEPTFTYDKNGRLLSATAYVKKQTKDGVWHELSASAFYSEYVQAFKDYNTGEFKPSQFWEKMPHNQLAKCAESLAIRRAFPAELSGVYTKEEMEQAESVDITPKTNPNQNASLPIFNKTISKEQAKELRELLMECPLDYQNTLTSFMEKQKIQSLEQFPQELYEKIVAKAKTVCDEYIQSLNAPKPQVQHMDELVEVEDEDSQ